MTTYQEFLAAKQFKFVSAGFASDLSEYQFFDYQRDIFGGAA